jgi:tetratricopeptide (TPR) repeat protein
MVALEIPRVPPPQEGTGDAHKLARKGYDELYLKGEPQEALEAYAVAGASAQRNQEVLAHIHWAMGAALHMLGRYDEALHNFDKALALDQNDWQLQISRGIALVNLGRLKEAIRAFDSALALNQDASVAEARRAVLNAALRTLVDEGFASWSGGKPKGSKRPVKLKAGPPVSDYIIAERDQRR